MAPSLRRVVGRVRRRFRSSPSTGAAVSSAPDEAVPLVRWAQRHGVPVTTVAETAVTEGGPPRTVEPDLLPTYGVDEDAVMDLLSPWGFEAIVPGELSLREQVVVFSGSDVVVSNHGSAFASALFAPPGLRLVDAVDPQTHHCAHVFWSLCGALGHEYWFLRADPVPAPDRAFDDVRIPLDRLAETLGAMGLDARA